MQSQVGGISVAIEACLPTFENFLKKTLEDNLTTKEELKVMSNKESGTGDNIRVEARGSDKINHNTEAFIQGPAPKHSEIDNLISGDLESFKNALTGRRKTLAPIMKNTLFGKERSDLKPLTTINGVDDNDDISTDEDEEPFVFSVECTSRLSNVFHPPPSKISSRSGSFKMTFSRQPSQSNVFGKR